VPGIKLSDNGINVETVSMNNTGVAGIFSLIPPYTQIESMLLSISNDYWLYASIPILVCVIIVHFICKHFFLDSLAFCKNIDITTCVRSNP
jgi:hypothetical protein